MHAILHQAFLAETVETGDKNREESATALAKIRS